MKKLFVFILALATIGMHHTALAKSKVMQVPLKHIDQLAFISYDLDLDETKVIVVFDEKNAEKSCVCSCRDNFWSCTLVECSYQNKECENFLPISLRDQNH